ncbi:MAG: hypothetical protein FWG81_04055 [Betaproteobacteria bacterium]|nr:hypothetical protein [Betaproteobacteria bacterium]
MRPIAERILVSAIALVTGFFVCYSFFYAAGIIVSSYLYLYMMSIDLSIGLTGVIQLFLSLVISLTLVLLIIFLVNKVISINRMLFKAIYAIGVVICYFLSTILMSATLELYEWEFGFEEMLMSFYYNGVYMGLLIGLPILFLGMLGKKTP